MRLGRALPSGTRPKATLDGRSLALRQHADKFFAAHLPEGWDHAAKVVVRLEGIELLGSPIAINAIVQVEGCVDSVAGDLHGWAWCPHAPGRDPILSYSSWRGVFPLPSSPTIVRSGSSTRTRRPFREVSASRRTNYATSAAPCAFAVLAASSCRVARLIRPPSGAALKPLHELSPICSRRRVNEHERHQAICRLFRCRRIDRRSGNRRPQAAAGRRDNPCLWRSGKCILPVRIP